MANKYLHSVCQALSTYRELEVEQDRAYNFIIMVGRENTPNIWTVHSLPYRTTELFWCLFCFLCTLGKIKHRSPFENIESKLDATCPVSSQESQGGHVTWAWPFGFFTLEPWLNDKGEDKAAVIHSPSASILTGEQSSFLFPSPLEALWTR